nr:MAG TPA: DNA repair metallo-beta-lactamase [Caudoviricetes sp.]
MFCFSYTINIQHLLSLVKLLNPRRIHRNVRL